MLPARLLFMETPPFLIRLHCTRSGSCIPASRLVKHAIFPCGREKAAGGFGLSLCGSGGRYISGATSRMIDRPRRTMKLGWTIFRPGGVLTATVRAKSASISAMQDVRYIQTPHSR